jgi:hypothetical protein
MSSHVLLAGAGNLVPSVALASVNAIIALALVSVSLLLVIAVSSVACFHDRPKQLQPIRRRGERSARERRQRAALSGPAKVARWFVYPAS